MKEVFSSKVFQLEEEVLQSGLAVAPAVLDFAVYSPDRCQFELVTNVERIGFYQFYTSFPSEEVFQEFVSFLTGDYRKKFSDIRIAYDPESFTVVGLGKFLSDENDDEEVLPEQEVSPEKVSQTEVSTQEVLSETKVSQASFLATESFTDSEVFQEEVSETEVLPESFSDRTFFISQDWRTNYGQ